MSANTYHLGICRICQKSGFVRHKNLYVTGSEGLWLCWQCEEDILNYIRSKMLKFSMERKEKYKSARKVMG